MWTRDFLLTSRILKASVPCTFLHRIAQNPEPTTQHHLISLSQNSIEFKCDRVSETKKSIDLPHNKFQIIFFFHRNELEGKGFWETKRGRGGDIIIETSLKTLKNQAKYIGIAVDQEEGRVQQHRQTKESSGEMMSIPHWV